MPQSMVMTVSRKRPRPSRDRRMVALVSVTLGVLSQSLLAGPAYRLSSFALLHPFSHLQHLPVASVATAVQPYCRNWRGPTGSAYHNMYKILRRSFLLNRKSIAPHLGDFCLCAAVMLLTEDG